MWKVIIVDDEMLARAGLKSLIDWEKEGFTVVGEAGNGEQALELIHGEMPDIVVTDYKMPVMDGIQLLLKCRQENLPAKFLVLSAYSDYEYVRSTLKNGAVDYLLKLELEPETLLQALQKAAEQIESERSREVYAAAEQTVRQSDIRHAYRQLINGCSAAMRSKYVTLLGNANMPVHQVALAVIHVLDGNKTELTYAQFSDTVGPMVNIVGDIAQSYVPAVALSVHRGGLLCVVFDCSKDHSEVDTSTAFAHRVREIVNRLFHYSVFIGCSFVKKDCDRLNEAWSEAFDAMHLAELYNLEICTAAATRQISSTSPNMENILSDVNRAIETVDYPLLHRTLCAACTELLSQKQPDPQYLTGLCYLLIFQYGNLMRNMRFSEEEIVAGRQTFRQRIRSIASKEGVICFIRETDQECGRLMLEDRTDPAVTRAKMYVQQHISESVSLEDVAAEVSLSAGYLSKLFYRCTGYKFTTYVMTTKVNAAKARLLAGNMNVSAVAESLGFENVTYFSKVFKKFTGQTPQGYQQGSTHQTPEKNG